MSSRNTRRDHSARNRGTYNPLQKLAYMTAIGFGLILPD